MVLESGEEIRAKAVASSADLRVTFARLVGLEQLPADYAGIVRGFRFRGATAKVNLALDACPDFALPAGSGAAPRRRHLDFAEPRVSRAGL